MNAAFSVGRGLLAVSAMASRGQAAPAVVDAMAAEPHRFTSPPCPRILQFFTRVSVPYGAIRSPNDWFIPVLSGNASGCFSAFLTSPSIHEGRARVRVDRLFV